ncbi:MAG: hypothetical protein CFH40_01437, partial [Alphaproteobacteria bacterium MarineAlpha10_Bin3]
MPCRHRRGAGDPRARRNVAHESRFGGDLRPRPDPQMPGNSDLGRDDDIIFQDRAAADANLRDNDASLSDTDVVTDLHKIINHRSVADHRVGAGTPVHGRVRADFDIVPDDHAAKLRHLDVPGGIDREAKATLPDPNARMNEGARTDIAMAERCIGANRRIGADLDRLPDHHIGADIAACPQHGAGADYLMKHLPNRNQALTSYYWYYATQVMYHMQGKYWLAWNEPLRKTLVSTQLTTGQMAGTWNPADNWENQGGRIYATAMKLLV